MTGDEKEFLKISAEAAIKPVGNLIERAFGPAADEFGTMLKGEIKLRRKHRLDKLSAKFDAQVKQAGFHAREIPDYILLPLLESASLQDDEFLQDKWASLLANAADPREENPIEPVFISILAELSPRVVKFLDALYSFLTSSNYRPVPPAPITASSQCGTEQLLNTYARAGLGRVDRLAYLSYSEYTRDVVAIEADYEDFWFLMDIVKRTRIVAEWTIATPLDLMAGTGPRVDDIEKLPVQITTTPNYTFTRFGLSFVKACRPPKNDS